MRESSARALLLLAPLALVACGGSGPGETPPVNPMTYGRFDLVTYDAKPLPDTLRVITGNSSTPGGGSVSCPEILLGATLDVATDGTITRTSRLAYPCTGTLSRPSDLPDSLTKTETGKATISGASVMLSFWGSTPGASITTAEYGQLRDVELVIDQVRSTVGLGSVETLANARVYRHE